MYGRQFRLLKVGDWSASILLALQSFLCSLLKIFHAVSELGLLWSDVVCQP